MICARSCLEHPALNEGSDCKGLLLSQLQCVRPCLLLGTSVEGNRQNRGWRVQEGQGQAQGREGHMKEATYAV